MQSNPSARVVGPDAPTLTEGAAAWSALCEAIEQRARLDARIVELTGAVQRSGTIEALEGVTLDTALNLVHRLPGADRSMQITAAEVLRDMPATMGLFKAAQLSWGQVRGIVAEVRRLPRELRAIVDARIGASRDRLAKMDPDDLIDQVIVCVQELRDSGAVLRAQRNVARRNFIWAQPALVGPGKIYGELDNPSLATVITAIDAHAPAGDGRPLSQRRADGLVDMAAHRCPNTTGDTVEVGVGRGDVALGDAGAGGAGTDADAVVGDGGARRAPCHRRIDRALPAFDVIVDTRDVTINAAGTISVAANGALPTLTAAACEALAAHAQVRAILMEGGRPIAVTRKIWAKALPNDVRRAVKARDRGDRFPGSRRPIEHVHHLDKDQKGHHVDHLVGLSDASHKRIHGHGWKISVDPPTGEVTFTRGERTWTTLPRGTRLRHPQPSP